VHDPRREADERLRGSHDVYVLEPSPPAVREAPWLADDPAVPTGPRERPSVTPTTLGDVTWDQLAHEDPTLAPWCADRWLGVWRRLPHPPPKLVGTRHSLHAIAERVIAPYRYQKTGRIGLRWTRNGFGTPFLPGDEQIRIDDGLLVVRREGAEIQRPVTTLRDAANLLGIEPGPPDLYQPEHHVDPDVRLPVEFNAADFLGEFFGFSASVLEQLRAEAGEEDRQATRVQLWPEHFDMAIELGDEAAGRRAGFGASPGDNEHDSPYFYVVPWRDVDPDPFWDATGFRGAELRIIDLVDVDDQRGVVLEFFRRGRAVLG
jgi:hypothetical protein